ncbi:hypothetical protein [Streptomyces sp. CB03238]|uniref:hypothetical protein n=1 Tax=Streptomyces sp. CB03238 TaxID=1907777 RepID=UPI00117C9553|nr:hypothetical protein [Streptomyces sp. CB03238]
MEPMSKDELAAKYEDPEFQGKLFRLTSMGELVGACLIANNFRPSKEFYEAIRLTSYGEEKVQQFLRKKIPYQEARLSCFLEFSWVDLLVDVEATDDAVLQRAIGDHIKNRDMNYPFVFGRELYDRAFEKLTLKDETAHPSLSETLEFLDDTPQGVFQAHNMVTGPYGLLDSEQIRFYSPDRHPELMHCSDVNCNRLHQVHFATSQTALINKHRREVTRTLRRESETPSAWGSFLSDLFNSIVKPARDDVGDALIPLIGDALTEDELKRCIEWLLDKTSGRLRALMEGLGVRGKAEDITAHLNRAEMMQLALTLGDRDLINCLDSLVHSGVIRVPKDEVRTPIVNETSFGKFGLTAELGSRGVRLQARAMNAAPLRLRHLIESMYRLDRVDDREELDWQLRSEEADSLEAKLDIYLQNRSPREVLQALVLARKSNAVTACEVLRLREGAADSPDFIPVILWKLGFGSNLNRDPHKQFWRLHEDMERMVRGNPGSPLGPTLEQFRGAVANYFVELETVLDDSLSFTVWALTNDHMTSKRPFTYRPDEEIGAAHAWLQEAATRSGDNALEYGDHVSLYGLCRGFQTLAAELVRMAGVREDYVRPRHEIPDWSRQQHLQKFPFMRTAPFLDLTDRAREAIVENLHKISRTLVSNQVYSARNDWLHGRREVAPPDRVRSSLHAIGSAVQAIEDAGFARIPYAVSSRTSDGYGRSVATLASARDFEFSIFNPTRYDWLGLPGVGDAVHVMNAAVFSPPNHVLRFVSEVSSPYAEMWSDYPKRKPRSQRAIKSIDATPAPED